MSGWNNRAYFFNQFVFGIFLIAVFGLSAAPLRAGADDDAAIAKSLADMLRAARQVISSNQSRINDPNLGDKGLSGQVVLQQAVEIYKKDDRNGSRDHRSGVAPRKTPACPDGRDRRGH